jgi:WD40 repeat protein
MRPVLFGLALALISLGSRASAASDPAGTAPVVLGRLPFQHADRIAAADFAPDGSSVLTASNDGVVTRWNADGTVSLWRQRSPATSVAVHSPKGRYVAAAGYNYVEVRDAQTGQRLWISNSASGYSLRFSADEKELRAVDGWLVIRTYSSADGKLLGETPRQQGDVVKIVLSRDAKWVAASHDDGVIRVWDAATAKISRELADQSLKASSLDFSPDSNQLAISDRSTPRVVLWDLAQGTKVRTWTAGGGSVTSVRFTTDGQHVLASSENLAKISLSNPDPDGAKFYGRIPGPVAAISPDDRRIAIMDGGGTRLTLAPIGRFVPVPTSGHAGAVSALEFTGSDKILLSGGEDGMVLCWNLESRGAPREIAPAQDGPVAGLCATPDGARVAISHPRSIQMRGLRKGEQLANFQDRWDRCQNVWISANGEHVLSAHPTPGGCGAYSFENGLRSWSRNSAACVRFKLEDMRGAHAFAVSPDERTATFVSFAYGGGGSPRSPRVDRVDLASGAMRTLCQLPEDLAAQIVVMNAGGTRFAVAAAGRVTVYDTASGKVVGHMDMFGAEITALAMSTNGEAIAIGGIDGAVQWASVDGKKPPIRWELGPFPVSAVAFARHAGMIAAGGRDGTLHLLGH